ncbi:uncharacterized protein LOC141656822 [Silene latifolia]|uniref:uncharacterized protein LOC141656822 n=1 Tax=Silene latifolia TaxID=37657 RepID=UPI003D789427
MKSPFPFPWRREKTSVKNRTPLMTMIMTAILATLLMAMLPSPSLCVPMHKAFRRDQGSPQWHHGAFHDVRDSIRSDVRRMLHSRAEVPFQVPLEVNIVLVGFDGDGGYRYTLDTQKLQEFLKISFPTHRPSCLESGEPLDIEHHLVYNVFSAGQPELISLEKSLKEEMVAAGTARETEFGKEVPAFDVEATAVESVFEQLYNFIFDVGGERYSESEIDRPVPTAIFVLNFDKVRMDPRNNELNLEDFIYGKINQLKEDDMKKQEGDYIYRYRYNGGGASQVWLSSSRFAVIDLSAGPCTYGKIETEEGSIGSKTLPRIRNFIFPKGVSAVADHSSHDLFVGQLGSLISTTVEHVIAPDVRFETVDMTRRLLIPIVVLQNHNRYSIMNQGHNYSIDVEAIKAEVKKMVHQNQDVVIVGGVHALHQHEKLAIAVAEATRGNSVHETKNDGRFHVRTKTYLDGAILKEEMERSADVLAAGILEVADPTLKDKFFIRQTWMDESDGSSDSILKHKPLWESYNSKLGKARKKRVPKKKGNLFRTYGTRVIPVFVLSLADVDPHLMMEDESMVWTSKDVVVVLEHQSEEVPLSYVSETKRRHALPSQAQRHIVAGLASVVGGLSAPYERASHIHERPVINWLWAVGCHPFGPFSNSSKISQILHDVARRNTIYAHVDSALRRIRETSEVVQAFASEYLKTPLGEPVKGKKNKTTTELWLEKFYKKTTHLPEPFPHELVERLEKYLDNIEEQLVDLSSLLYDHRLQDAHFNSSEILQTSIFTQQYVDSILVSEREKMKCCSIEYKSPRQTSQTFIYGGILIAGFVVYFLVIFFSNPVR